MEDGEERSPRGWPRRRTPYETWVHAQGVPVIAGYGVTDPAGQEFGHWDRIGADAYFVIMKGMEGITGQCVVRLPAGGSTKRERHLYEKVIYILQGSGATVVEDGEGKEHTFEWQRDSVFAIPLNCPHRIYAHGEPVLYSAFTTAPMVFDLFYLEEFVYDNPFAFRNRFDGQPDYFTREVREGRTWETNFIPSARLARIERGGGEPGMPISEQPGALSSFEMANNSLIGHLATWPVGQYRLAHYHGGGAILQIVESEGYTLMWSNEFGERPFESGHGDQVVRVDWKPGSAFSPPTNWYHQHFNTGSKPALQLALRNGSTRFPLGIRAAHGEAVTSVISPTREDPEIKRTYGEEIRLKGIR